MKEIATDENLMNDTCYTKQFLSSEGQYKLMRSVFPRLESHCNENQFNIGLNRQRSGERQDAHEKISENLDKTYGW